MESRKHMNIQQKLVEEFERIICVREGWRAQFKAFPITVNEEQALKARAEVLAGLNEVIDVCREALMDDDALRTLKALECAKQVQ